MCDITCTPGHQLLILTMILTIIAACIWSTIQVGSVHTGVCVCFVGGGDVELIIVLDEMLPPLHLSQMYRHATTPPFWSDALTAHQVKTGKCSARIPSPPFSLSPLATPFTTQQTPPPQFQRTRLLTVAAMISLYTWFLSGH